MVLSAITPPIIIASIFELKFDGTHDASPPMVRRRSTLRLRPYVNGGRGAFFPSAKFSRKLITTCRYVLALALAPPSRYQHCHRGAFILIFNSLGFVKVGWLNKGRMAERSSV